MLSCLYQGYVQHRRLNPAQHVFRYGLYMAYLDLDELVSGLTAEQFEAWVQESEEYRALHLPGPTAPGFTRKTRDQVCAVQTNFCNLRDRTGQPQFSPFACALPPAQQEEWIQNEVAAGSTHFVVAVDVNSTAYLPPEGHAVNYYRDDQHEEYRAFLSRVLSWGLTPIVFLHSGDFYAGDDPIRSLLAITSGGTAPRRRAASPSWDGSASVRGAVSTGGAAMREGKVT